MIDEIKPRGRLLVVEDEALVAMLIEDILLDAGFEVLGPFGQVERAIDCLHQGEPIDAAVLDINLGDGERSYAVAGELSARGVPFLFLTGYGEVGLDRRYAGTPVLQKPFAPKALPRAIERLLDRAA